MRKKNLIIIVMCVAICVMVVGYGAFNTLLTITGTANIASEWKVVFTNITQVSKTSGVNVKATPVASGTSATFNVGLTSPGDKIVYKITLANQGTIDAVIRNIEASATDSPAIIFTIDGVNTGDVINKKTSKDFTVTIEYDPYVTSQPEKLEKTLTVSITTEQKVNQNIENSTPNVNQPTYLSSAILKNNIAQSDANIDFSKTSEETGTNGLYYTSTNTENNQITYYFRGDVDNNYVRTELPVYEDFCRYNGQDVYDDTLSEPVSIENCTSTNVCDLGGNYVVGLDEETCNQTFDFMLSELGLSSTMANCQYNGKVVLGMDFSGEEPMPVELTETQCTSNYVCEQDTLGISGIDEETCLALGGTYTYEKAVYKEFNPYTNKKAVVTRELTYMDSITWRIVRINEDGSIRLITQNSVGDSAFNENSDDNAYVGYMYGSIGQSGTNAYNLTHSNDNPSTIKTYLDDWYVRRLSNYTDIISMDAGFCNDRSVAPSAGLWDTSDTALGYGSNRTYYGAYNRLVNEYQPQFKCPNEGRDLFTTSSSTKGNKALTNPIGLLTADEFAYAGGVDDKQNLSMYLIGSSDWTMSPYNFIGDFAIEWYLSSAVNGYRGKGVSIEFGVRPVVNLRSGVEIIGGDGTSGNPYIIRVN